MQIGHGKSVHVCQGEFKVSDDPDDIFVTVLGSCVAVALYDPARKAGGLNHFLLPGGEGFDPNSLRYGTHSMELLINGLLKLGARRSELRAKVFGGAKMMDGLSDIGQKNASFILDFLKTEDIKCVNQSLGGTQARKLRFWPTTGEAKQFLVAGAWDDPVPTKTVRPTPPKDDITFF